MFQPPEHLGEGLLLKFQYAMDPGGMNPCVHLTTSEPTRWVTRVRTFTRCTELHKLPRHHSQLAISPVGDHNTALLKYDPRLPVPGGYRQPRSQNLYYSIIRMNPERQLPFTDTANN